MAVMIAVVYHSGYGHTKRMAEAVAAGAGAALNAAAGDLETARLYGARVAETAARFDTAAK